MNILMLGAGKGSWDMRGRQLGAAIGARVTSGPTVADWKWADLAILVKRAGRMFSAQARDAGVPIVWDAVDFWRQPGDNAVTDTQARALLHKEIDAIRPALVIGATRAMAEAAGGVYLPHHGRLGLTPTPARNVARLTVGYDGNPMYLDRWLAILQAACTRRGWTFVVNPLDLSAVDILVGFRGGIWDGWICREWKSGVKAVNAIRAGRPFISQASAAVTELRPIGSIAETAAELELALDRWRPLEARQRAADEIDLTVSHEAAVYADELTLAAVGQQYRRILATIGSAVSC